MIFARSGMAAAAAAAARCGRRAVQRRSGGRRRAGEDGDARRQLSSGRDILSWTGVLMDDAAVVAADTK